MIQVILTLTPFALKVHIFMHHVFYSGTINKVIVPRAVLHCAPQEFTHLAFIVARTFYGPVAFVVMRILATLELLVGTFILHISYLFVFFLFLYSADDETIFQAIRLPQPMVRQALETFKKDRIVG
jgi:hypothetical protein